MWLHVYSFLCFSNSRCWWFKYSPKNNFKLYLTNPFIFFGAFQNAWRYVSVPTTIVEPHQQQQHLAKHQHRATTPTSWSFRTPAGVPPRRTPHSAGGHPIQVHGGSIRRGPDGQTKPMLGGGQRVQIVPNSTSKHTLI